MNIESAATSEQHRIESTAAGRVGAARGIDAVLCVGNDYSIELRAALSEVQPVDIVLIHLSVQLAQCVALALLDGVRLFECCG